MYKCNRCGKGAQVGMNVSHSHIRTKKRSMPNLHPYKIRKDGRSFRGHFCTKCLRIVKKGQAILSTDKSKTIQKIEDTIVEESKEPVEVAQS